MCSWILRVALLVMASSLAACLASSCHPPAQALNGGAWCPAGYMLNTASSECCPLIPPAPKKPCVDKAPHCRHKAFLCKTPAYSKLYAETCPVTCGVCSGDAVLPAPRTKQCVDKAPDCQRNAFLCDIPSYKNLLDEVCAATCGSCTAVSVLPRGSTVSPRASAGPSAEKCTDLASQCAEWADRCEDQAYAKLLHEVCALTCKSCGKNQVTRPAPHSATGVTYPSLSE